MKNLYEMLLEEQRKLQKIVQETRERLTAAPEGSLRLSSCRGKTQYYLVLDDKKRSGTYIKKDQEKIITKLAQKEYDEKILRASEKQLKSVERLLTSRQENDLLQIYEGEHIERKKLIHPVIPPYEKRVEAWLAVPYVGKNFPEGTPLILTENGERVRSKSEKIIADFLLRNHIPYKYECPLLLKGYGTIYPDFTMISKETGQEVYLEHEGKMDDPDYVETALRKIELYERNGILPGERLILTYETSKYMLNTAALEILLKQAGVL